MGDVDAVAGGGPNGLAAAFRLAEAGWSVCLAVPPGAGVHGACGDLAARQAMADRRRTGRLATAAAVGTAIAALQATRRRR